MGLQSAGDRFAEKIPSFSDNFTKIRGAHTYKMGFAWQENNDNQVSDTYSLYVFRAIADYLAAKSGANPFGYTQFATVLGAPGRTYKSYFYDFYVQDSWQIRPNLLLIYGVRWDRFQAPDGEANAPFIFTQKFHTPNRDWAPRLGSGLVARVRRPWYGQVGGCSTKRRPPIRGSTLCTMTARTGRLWPPSANKPALRRFPNVFNFLPGATAAFRPEHLRSDARTSRTPTRSTPASKWSSSYLAE